MNNIMQHEYLYPTVVCITYKIQVTDQLTNDTLHRLCPRQGIGAQLMELPGSVNGQGLIFCLSSLLDNHSADKYWRPLSPTRPGLHQTDYVLPRVTII